jgi:hypothetical protein
VNSEDERKKKKIKEEEERKAAQTSTREKKAAKKDVDKLYEERLGGKKGAQVVGDLSGMSKGKQNELISSTAEQSLVEDIFQSSDVATMSLKSQTEYLNFAKKVRESLHGGSAPYRIPNFFKELFKDLGKQCEAV